jgi:hypothetical protein
MKRLALVAAVASFALAGCMHPFNYSSDYVTVDPNQTAFLIALDGDSQANQMKMNSIDFLEKNRVATKRVEIPHKDVSLCPHCLTGDWQEMPVAILITIDRTPVTREWTSSERTGTSKSNQAFHVESRESIDFAIGATMTAHVTEEDAAKFLFYYGKMRRTAKGDYVLRSWMTSWIPMCAALSARTCRISMARTRWTMTVPTSTIFSRRCRPMPLPFSRRAALPSTISVIPRA